MPNPSRCRRPFLGRALGVSSGVVQEREGEKKMLLVSLGGEKKIWPVMEGETACHHLSAAVVQSCVLRDRCRAHGRATLSAGHNILVENCTAILRGKEPVKNIDGVPGN